MGVTTAVGGGGDDGRAKTSPLSPFGETPRRICKFACQVKSLRVFPLMVQKAVTGESLKQFGFNFLFKSLKVKRFDFQKIFRKHARETATVSHTEILCMLGTKEDLELLLPLWL